MATKFKKLQTKPKLVYTPSPLFQPLINWQKLIGRLMMSIGVLVLVGTIFLTQMAYISPDKEMVVLSKEITNYSFPTSLQFQNNTFDIEKGTFKYGLWPLSDSKPVYLESSGTPGQSGNIIIYGHNTSKVFGNLDALQQGSEVTLTTNSNEIFIYKVDLIKKVFPQDVEILQQGSEERITLFTCTGLFDSMRLIVSGTRIH